MLHTPGNEGEMQMSEDRVIITSLGGSGENGRNCYLIDTGGGSILLDCGVKREIQGGQVGFYPAITREIVSGLKAVFLSHCHEDHVAALPLLYELGYRGLVYGSEETLAEVPGFIRKWMAYAVKNGGTLPYCEESLEKIRFAGLGLGASQVQGIQVETGRSGHVLGGIWYIFTVQGHRILYTGDMTLKPAVLAVDLPGPCDAAIMNAAYAGKCLDQEEQYRRLNASVCETVRCGGKVLLPVPPKGRGIDLYLHLKTCLPEVRLYVEKAVVDSSEKLAEETAWIKGGIDTRPGPGVTVICTPKQREEAMKAEGPGVYLTPDGMLTTPDSLAYLEALKGSTDNRIIITGHAAQGTAGEGILNEDYRREHGVRAKAEKIIFKVHLDDEDILFLADWVNAGKLMLFHSDQECTSTVKGRLSERGRPAVTGVYPDYVVL